MITLNISWLCKECKSECTYASAIKSPITADIDDNYFQQVADMVEKQTSEKLCITCEELYQASYKENVK